MRWKFNANATWICWANKFANCKVGAGGVAINNECTAALWLTACFVGHRPTALCKCAAFTRCTGTQHRASFCNSAAANTPASIYIIQTQTRVTFCACAELLPVEPRRERERINNYCEQASGWESASIPAHASGEINALSVAVFGDVSLCSCIRGPLYYMHSLKINVHRLSCADSQRRCSHCALRAEMMMMNCFNKTLLPLFEFNQLCLCSTVI